jgi:hypothetical protein
VPVRPVFRLIYTVFDDLGVADLLLVAGIPPLVGNAWRSNCALARAQDQFPPSHPDA